MTDFFMAVKNVNLYKYWWQMYASYLLWFGFCFCVVVFFLSLFFKSFSLNATCVECPTFRVVREVLSGSWLEGMELRRCPCFLSVTHSCQVEPQRRGH